MSRRRSTSNVMGPPPDIVMGPPPVPAPLSSSSHASSQGKSKDNSDIAEKYRKLKRRFFELEEKHKETTMELQRSGERNVRMREERNVLLDRIIELEAQPAVKTNGASPLPISSSSAFPRTLLDARARSSFVSNLRQAVEENDADADIDPLLTSRHVGPLARQREEQERRERLEEEARGSLRRGRSSQQHANATHKGKEVVPERSPLLTYSPSPQYVGPGVQGSPHSGPAPPLVSSSGTRLRIKPPAPPSGSPISPLHSPVTHNAVASSSSNRHSHSNSQSPLPSTQSHPHSYTHPPPPPPPHFQQQLERQHQQQLPPQPSHQPRSESPVGMVVDNDHPSPPSMDMDPEPEYTPPPPTNNYYRNTTPSSQRGHSHRGHSHSNGNGHDHSHSHGTSNSNSNSTNSGTTSPTFPLRMEGVIPTAPVIRTSASPVPTTKRKRSESSDSVTSARKERKSATPNRQESKSPVVFRNEQSSNTPVIVNAPSPVSASTPPPPISAPSPVTVPSPAQKEATPTPPAAVATPVAIPTPPPVSVPSPIAEPAPTAPEPATPTAPQAPVVISAPAPAPTPTLAPVTVTPASAAAPSSTQTTTTTTTAMPQIDNVKASSSAPPVEDDIDMLIDPALRGPPSTKVTTAITNSKENTTTPGTSDKAASGANKSATTSTTPIATAYTMPSTTVNPYSQYYPIGASPTTPTYPHYPNPYYPYHPLGAGPIPGPSAMYAPITGFVPPSSQRPPSEVQRHAKPKRLKAHTVTTKSFSIPMVPRDKKGKPMLPLNVGIMTVICLGDVCMREHFHTERYIFPVGYEVTRRYLSTVDPTVEVVYHCTILDGGDGPKFQIVPSDVPDRPVIAGTATGAWSSIVKQANSIRNRQHSNSVSGPDFFGLGQNTIKHLIQELPNADRLRDYVWQNFVEGGPLGGRHAAVIPALPEEYDASMPIGAYYPSEREKLKRDAANPDSPRGLAHYPAYTQHQTPTLPRHAPPPKQQQYQQQKAQQPPPQQPTQSQASGSNSASTSSSAAQSEKSVQPGVTQIFLPPPTTSETLNIQEYQPPPKKNPYPVLGENSPGQGHNSQSPPVTTRQTRSSSRSQSQSHNSPYLANANTPTTSASPPSVPPTFASIMNAYPAPGAAPNSNGSATGGAE